MNLESLIEKEFANLNKLLSESYGGYPDNWINPNGAYEGAKSGELWEPLGYDQEELDPFIKNEQQLADTRKISKWLVEHNGFAAGALQNRINFCYGAGAAPQVSLRKPKPNPAESETRIIEDAQRILDEWVIRHDWYDRQAERLFRHDRDGDAIIRFFDDQEAGPVPRFIQAWQVHSPNNGDRWSDWGVQCRPGDIETVVGYWIRYDLGEQPEFVPATQIQHDKQGVTSDQKRGRPLLYNGWREVDTALKIVRKMGLAARVQASIALIRRLRNASNDQIKAFADRHKTGTQRNTSGGEDRIMNMEGGLIYDIGENVDYEMPIANVNAGSFGPVVAMHLRVAAARCNMPEYMFTADASNANYSSTMVAESPAVRAFQRLQRVMAEGDITTYRRVLTWAEETGQLPFGATTDLLTIKTTPVSLEVRDKLKDTQRRSIMHRSGVISTRTWATEEGYDPATEEYHREEEQKKQPEQPGGVDNPPKA